MMSAMNGKAPDPMAAAIAAEAARTGNVPATAAAATTASADADAATAGGFATLLSLLGANAPAMAAPTVQAAAIALPPLDIELPDPARPPLAADDEGAEASAWAELFAAAALLQPSPQPLPPPVTGAALAAATIDAGAQPATALAAPSGEPGSSLAIAAPATPATQALDGQAVAAPAREAHLPSPVGTPTWRRELSHEVQMLLNHRTESATLHVTPADLGPIEVSIRFDGDAASVQFGAAHADTRAALESTLPKLRELFEDSGLTLADAGVHSQREREPAPPTLRLPGSGGADDPETAVVATVQRLGLVDDYA